MADRRLARTALLTIASVLFVGDIGRTGSSEDFHQASGGEPVKEEVAKPSTQHARPYLLEWLGEPAWLEAGGEYRLRYETMDNRYRLGEHGGDQQLAHRLHLRFGIQRVLDPFRFLVEFEDSRAQLTDSDSFVNASHIRKLSVLQLHGKLITESLFGRGVASEFRFGRFTMDLGKRRLVARNVFRNTVNRFDGIRWVVARPARWELQLFAVRPVVYRMPDLNHGRRQGYFSGLYYRNESRRQRQYDLYYLHIDEGRAVPREIRLRAGTFGGRLYSGTREGWTYELEMAAQIGSAGGRRHRAHMENAEAGYQFDRGWSPSLTFTYAYASGDRDPLDTRSGRFNSLFGARRFDLAPTGIYALFSRSNISSPGYRFRARPARRLELSFAHREFWLAQARDEWYGTLRRDVTGRSGTHLGHHLEGVAGWSVSPNLQFEAGYARFLPGGFALSQNPVAGKHGLNYFYVMNEVRF